MVTQASAEAESLLGRMREERGYALSYHEILAATAPELLSAYRGLYARFTLDERHLDVRDRELIWTGLLTTAHEHVGDIHLDRAIAVGVGQAELRAAMRLGAVANAFDAVDFACRSWSRCLDGATTADEYGRLVRAAGEPLEPVLVDLILLTVAGSRTCAAQFLLHLHALYRAEVDERHIAEAVSYLLLPKGANTLLWATDLWMDELREGRLPLRGVLAGVSFDVRRG